jgi:hypothetical protein
MAQSKMQPAQVRDALPSSCGTTEEKGSGRRGRTELGPRGIEERSPSIDGFRRGGRDAAIGVQEENITHVPATSRASHVDR